MNDISLDPFRINPSSNKRSEYKHQHGVFNGLSKRGTLSSNEHITRKSHLTKSTSKTAIEPRTDFVIVSDSQGRGISQEINYLNSGDISATGIVMPNTGLLHVVDTAIKENGKVIAILGGTNNTLGNTTNDIYLNLEQKLQKLNKNKAVLLCTIPQRHDAAHNDMVHAEVQMLNNYIVELVARLKNVYLIDTHLLNRSHYTNHGLHLNYKGKKELARLMLVEIERIVGKSVDKVQWTNAHGRSTFSASKTTQRPPKLITTKENIHFIESDMTEVIDIHSSDDDTAFAHCISADFNSNKQMSKGVAVTFKQKFNRPCLSDYCDVNLTCQKTKQGAIVYSLVTKEKYYQNSKNFPQYSHMYNSAFIQLAKDFKLKNLKTLICSPMGCVRDRVSPHNFITNLLKFKSITGASIVIVTYNEDYTSATHNGMSYTVFVKQLQELITCSPHFLQLNLNEQSPLLHAEGSVEPEDTVRDSLPGGSDIPPMANWTTSSQHSILSMEDYPPLPPSCCTMPPAVSKSVEKYNDSSHVVHQPTDDLQVVVTEPGTAVAPLKMSNLPTSPPKEADAATLSTPITQHQLVPLYVESECESEISVIPINDLNVSFLGRTPRGYPQLQ